MIIKKILTITLILLFLWIMYITTAPIKPKRLPQRFPICNLNDTSSWGGPLYIESISQKSSDNPHTNYIRLTANDTQIENTFRCKSIISEMTLYKAKTISIIYEVDQPARLTLSIHRLGKGHFGETVNISAEDVNKKLTNTWLLEEGNEYKASWLSGTYDSAVISLMPSSPSNSLNLNIYDIYLE